MRRTLAKIGRRLRQIGPALLAAGVLVALFSGSFSSLAEMSRTSTFLLGALAGMVCFRWHGWITSRARAGEKLLLQEAELGALLLVGAFAVVEPHGRLENPFFPLLYLLMAFIAASSLIKVTVALTLLAIAIESSLFLTKGHPWEAWPLLASRLFFLAAFAFLPRITLALEAANTRLSGRSEVERKDRERREDARRYRLSAAEDQPGGDEKDAADKWLTAAVEEVGEALANTLEVAEYALGTRSIAVFLKKQDEHSLLLHDCRPRVEDLVRKDFDAKEGILGAAIQTRRPLRLCGDLRGISWYDGKEPIQSVLIVPLVDHRNPEDSGAGRLRGLLVADRLEPVPFEDDDEKLLLASGREILRAMDSEWVMAQVLNDRKRAEDTYRAIGEFNQSSKTEQVLDTAVQAVRATLGRRAKDLIAITTFETDPVSGKGFHTVERIEGMKGLEKLQGRVFPDGNCLVSQAVRRNTKLPARPPGRSERVFGDDTLIRGVASLRVVPLQMGEEVLGTLVFGSEEEGVLKGTRLQTLELIASQVAQSLQRASYFAATEALADTDGLTGLTNRRVFEEELTKAINTAKRGGRPVAVIVADIDHFKTVNDTYGHLTGDEILRKVAEILRSGARTTDIVARYGGEEFTLILPENDMEGGRTTAERIRQEVESTVFRTSLGPLRCTISLGIASYPDVAADDLLEQADQALYHCKRMGRNRSATAAEAQAPTRPISGVSIG